MARGLFTLKQQLRGVIDGSWSPYTPPKSIEYLVVAGGGGGSYFGGGGAGGLLQGQVPVTTGSSITVTVGAGGTGTTGNSDNTTQGAASVLGSISAGGGGAGFLNYIVNASKNNGGSGGGGGYSEVPQGQTIFGYGIVGQGNAGGKGTHTFNSGGGGGGAGTVGLDSSSASGANGGAGIASAISGTVIIYAGGGGSGGGSGGSIGGVGGGGAGGSGAGTPSGTAGSANTGGGGGGAAYNVSFGTGGAGGSGIVVVRYPGNIQFYTGGTLSYSNGFMVHTFYSSGTLAPTTPRLFTNPDYQIARSLRFNSPDVAYLNRTPASASNRTTWTWSAWIKLGKLGTTRVLLSCASGGNETVLFLGGGDTLLFHDYQSAAYTGRLVSNQYLRDVSAWYHVVAVWDTTNSVAGNRMRLYINGIELDSFSTDTQPPQNTVSVLNAATETRLGGYSPAAVTFDGYMTEVNFVDGQQLTPGSFGYLEPSTGVWTPLQYTGSYGTNGFYLNFADNSNTTAATLGKDLSGNGNNFTPTNFSVTAGVNNDSLLDSPTNYGTDTGAGGEVRGNYATLNPLAIHSSPGGGNSGLSTFSNGNLESVNVQTSWCDAFSTIAVSSGKFYAEFSTTSAGDRGVGIFNVGNYSVSALTDLFFGGGGNTAAAGGYAYYASGQKQNGTNVASYGASWTDGDIIGVALDMDAGTLVFYKNGVSQGTAYTGLSGMFAFAITAYYSSATKIANFGQRPFAYTAPSGFKALCSQNLPTSILPQTAFAVNTFTGTNSSRIIGTGIQSDLVLTKNLGAYSILWHDALRGAGRTLYGGENVAEVNNGSVYIQTFNSSSYGIGGADNALNAATGNFISWVWNAGGTTVTNTTGGISAQVRANSAAGFSIVTYTGTGSNATVGHGLGVAPSMFIVKRRSDTENWCTYHQSLGATKALFLNLTDAEATNSVFFNNTAPTSSVFSIGTNPSVNTNTSTYVAYCFAEVPGYSRFGSYTGNGSADGPFVYCGFRPRLIMIKRTSSSGTYWNIYDTVRSSYNVADDVAYTTNGAEAANESTLALDILSNGFKIRTTGSSINNSGDTYIFAAFAESPLKYSRAR
jgi:hypothetical protein